MIDPEFKEKWIAALRSGEYKKGTGSLYEPAYDRYCCLGVACVVSGMTIDEIDGPRGAGFAYAAGSGTNGFGLDQVWRVYAMNDNAFREDEDFKRIAAWIEENV